MAKIDKLSKLVQAMRSGKNQPMWSTGSRTSRAPSNVRTYTQAEIDELNAKMKGVNNQVVGRDYLNKKAEDFNDYNQYYGNPDTDTGIIGRDMLQDPSTGNLNPDTMLIRDKAKFYDYYDDDLDSMGYDEALKLLQEGGLLGKPF